MYEIKEKNRENLGPIQDRHSACYIAISVPTQDLRPSRSAFAEYDISII